MYEWLWKGVNVEEDCRNVDFLNDEIMKSCLKVTIDAIPTFEDFMGIQEDCPQEFVRIVNENFKDLV